MSKFKVPESWLSSSRGASVILLTSVLSGQEYANLGLNRLFKHYQFSQVDRHLTTQLVYGTLQHHLELSQDLAHLVLQWSKLPLAIQLVLEVALYQIRYLNRVPQRAAIYEAVELVKGIQGNRYVKVVNAVLRRVQREGLDTLPQLSKNPSLAELAYFYSVPEWLIRRLTSDYGKTVCHQIIASLNQPPLASARLNTKKTTLAQLLATSQAQSEHWRPSTVSEVGLVANQGNFALTTAFAEGLVTVQDESSMLVAPSLHLQPHHLVLDACAAPGGKTTHIAQYLDAQQNGHVVALDIHAHKLDLINQNARRLGLADCIETYQLDARHVSEKFADATFDRILVDAPCSGIGLLRRKPEIRFTKTEADIKHLPDIQLAILNATSTKLKRGGYLVYSTCTILKAENHEVITKFLAHHPDFKLESAKAPLSGASELAPLQLLPHELGSDGFFIAVLRRLE